MINEFTARIDLPMADPGASGDIWERMERELPNVKTYWSE